MKSETKLSKINRSPIPYTANPTLNNQLLAINRRERLAREPGKNTRETPGSAYRGTNNLCRLYIYATEFREISPKSCPAGPASLPRWERKRIEIGNAADLPELIPTGQGG